jgi:ammonia channel protein AmtB
MLTSTALVLMMTIPGLALFYGGMVRKTERARHDDAELCHLRMVTRGLDGYGHYGLAFRQRRQR